MVRRKSPTLEALQALVSKIPAKTLRAYVLEHLPTAPSGTLTALASFFATLTPPTLLHCVRCHTDYTEVENDNRSCRVPHDEDSAEVEWVGMDRNGNEYVTEYGCCGKTVDGEGDQGPPDGWCYEGMHTTDVKRARFRDDSSDDDMLESCVDCQITCAPSPDPRPRVGSSTGNVGVKRAPPPPVDLADSDDDDDDDDASRYTEDSSVVVEIVRGVSATKQKTVGQLRTKATARKVSATLGLARVPIASRGTSGAESSKAGKVRAPPASTPAARTPAPAEGKSGSSLTGKLRTVVNAVLLTVMLSSEFDCNEHLPKAARQIRQKKLCLSAILGTESREVMVMSWLGDPGTIELANIVSLMLVDADPLVGDKMPSDVLDVFKKTLNILSQALLGKIHADLPLLQITQFHEIYSKAPTWLTDELRQISDKLPTGIVAFPEPQLAQESAVLAMTLFRRKASFL
ncbi:hypothetical protein EDB84DRAFT_1438034 [Lactarius hengduanensis]|nr:hypothetical protein EDB84DRAFT_1438034 [Lactarius hengduanensis]